VAKVLWISDAGAHTGFARVTHSIGERLIDKGHDISVLAFNYRGDHWPTRLKLYRPNTIKNDDIWGKTRFIEMLAKVEPDVVVMVHDANLLISLLAENSYDPDKILLRYRPIITYIPVDGTNRPPGWAQFLGKVTNVVTMSKFGQEAFPGSQLAYHGVDEREFWPVSPERPILTSTGVTCTSKAECKEAFGRDPNTFLILRVDKNSGRKDWPATVQAVWPVMRRHPNVTMHLHTEARNDSGVLVDALLSREEALHGRFSTPDLHNSFEGWPQQDLNALVNSADLVVSTSRGEGFGLNLAEALMCEVPVIAQNVSAIPEVVGPGGILIEPQRLITVPSGQDLWLSDIGAFTEAIEKLYLDDELRQSLGKAGREHVLNSFSWDVAADQFDGYINALAAGVPETAAIA
jgi:glycosyltransferase involved in cell wall biosynthesis